MQKVRNVVLLALAAASCATVPPRHGNFLKSTTVDQQKLADETVKQMVAIWAPAKTRLEMRQATPDAFGTALVKGLRDNGYAVAELDQSKHIEKQAALAEKESGEPIVAPNEAKTYSLMYVLDQAGNANLYRLILMVGSQSITRPYLEQDGALVPGGYWARKE